MDKAIEQYMEQFMTDNESRLARIEERINTIVLTLDKMQERMCCERHDEKIMVLDRRLNGLLWVVATVGVTVIGAFIGHIIGGK